jgi:hypothetical protein
MRTHDGRAAGVFRRPEDPLAGARDGGENSVIRVDKFDAVARDIVNMELESVLAQDKDIKTALADAKALITHRARR